MASTRNVIALERIRVGNSLPFDGAFFSVSFPSFVNRLTGGWKANTNTDTHTTLTEYDEAAIDETQANKDKTNKKSVWFFYHLKWFKFRLNIWNFIGNCRKVRERERRVKINQHKLTVVFVDYHEEQTQNQEIKNKVRERETRKS